jgi:hypothetical protein
MPNKRYKAYTPITTQCPQDQVVTTPKYEMCLNYPWAAPFSHTSMLMASIPKKLGFRLQGLGFSITLYRSGLRL